MDKDHRIKEYLDEILGDIVVTDTFHRQMMNDVMKEDKKRRGIRSVMLAMAKAAAAVIVVLSLGISTVVAGNSFLRKAVFDLAFTNHPKYTEVQLVENIEKAFELPAEWKGRYFPSFIPKEYKLEMVTNSFDHTFNAVFMDEEGRIVHFSEKTKASKTVVDTEKSEVRAVLIRGYQGVISLKEGEVILVWSADERYFTLSIMGNEGLAIKIAESLVIIN